MTPDRDDLELFGEGRHPKLWHLLGAHLESIDGIDGARFDVWAPRALAVSVGHDGNGWTAGADPMQLDARSGVWSTFVPGASVGSTYKFAVQGCDGVVTWRADPMARRAELPPSNASVVTASSHTWHDEPWMRARAARRPTDGRLAIYEVHLGSWRHDDDGSVDYARIADELGDHVTALGFTHVELLPIAEHPYGGSWGYQVTGYFAPTARYGTPDGFRTFVDTLHQRGIGVLVDWVPAHFPTDEWALARFDGEGLYEHADPLLAAHPDWGTLVFDLTRPQVRNFLTSNARYWIDEFHVDGLRVDAVASMLYLDFSRGPREWTPNVHGGNEDLDAVAFLREVTSIVRDDHPDVLVVAEESTAWPGVSASVRDGGLGFTHKWNLGWMHDTLDYFARPTPARATHQSDLTFGLTYAWSERFVLPLSHDEVVHEKRSLFEKMPGDEAAKAANLRALYGWMWAHPGAKLLFMGGELGQRREWSDVRELDWDLLELPVHRDIADMVATINRVHAAEPALWADDFTPAGFQWVAGDDHGRSVVAFLRVDPAGVGRPVLCVASLGPVRLDSYRVGVPSGGPWGVLLDTSRPATAGSAVAYVEAEPQPWNGMAWSVAVDLDSPTVCWFAPLES